MSINNIYFQRVDNKQCNILDVMMVLSNCSKLEKSALSPQARFEGDIHHGLVHLSYYPEFFGIREEDFIGDISSAGYKKVKNIDAK